MGRTTSDLMRGIRRAGVLLLGFAWLATVFAGMGIVFSTSSHSPILGWALLTVAAFVLVVTMNRWIKVLPALLVYGVLGSLVSTLSGHGINHPETPVTISEGLFMI